ncbi:MAG TPA: sodium-independent anion transporter, partial [Luteimonas sp.]|nr:sodium-independent anion transporter [Luteimonas sp.]
SLERALSWSRKPPRTVVLRLDRVPFVDATGLKRLESTMAAMDRRGVQVLLTGANLRVLRKLVRAGLVARDAATNYFSDLSVALRWLQDQRDADPDQSTSEA